MFKIEAVSNEGDNLPFSYFDPNSGGTVRWVCGYDQDNKITSVFHYEGEGEEAGVRDKVCNYITMDQALGIRNTLINQGWKESGKPTVEYTLPSGEKTDKLNRQQRRRLKKYLDKQAKKNPFK